MHDTQIVILFLYPLILSEVKKLSESILRNDTQFTMFLSCGYQSILIHEDASKILMNTLCYSPLLLFLIHVEHMSLRTTNFTYCHINTYILYIVYCECRCSLLKFRVYIYHVGQRAKCKPIEMISNPMAVQDISAGTMHCQHDTQIVIPYSYIKAHSKPMTCVKVKQDYTKELTP